MANLSVNIYDKAAVFAKIFGANKEYIECVRLHVTC